MYTNSSELLDVVFVIDAVKEDENTVEMVSKLIEYVLPAESRIAVILAGGEGSETVFSLSDDPDGEEVVDYLLSMEPLGGTLNLLDAATEATDMIDADTASEAGRTPVIFMVVHDAPDDDQSPCSLGTRW